MARILITGAGSGIGRATAQWLAGRGHAVVATARRVETLADLDVAARLPVDVCDPAQVAACVAAAGDVDVLVNNAGVSLWGAMECCPLEEIERVIDTNLLGPILMANAVLPGMRARGRGKIIQVSSAAARNPNPLLGAYAASKAGLEAMSACLRVELHAFGIHVTVVSMGAVESGVDVKRRVMDASGTAYAELQRRAVARNSQARNAPAPATDVAAVIEGVIDDPSPPFLVYVGEQLQAVMARRAGRSDAEVEAETLASLGY